MARIRVTVLILLSDFGSESCGATHYKSETHCATVHSSGRCDHVFPGLSLNWTAHEP